MNGVCLGTSNGFAKQAAGLGDPKVVFHALVGH